VRACVIGKRGACRNNAFNRGNNENIGNGNMGGRFATVALSTWPSAGFAQSAYPNKPIRLSVLA
jgi:hypothetical protein